MRISDWSSDVCSSDLFDPLLVIHRAAHDRGGELPLAEIDDEARPDGHVEQPFDEGAARRQVAHHDAIAVIVVDRRDLAEQRDAVGTLLRRPRWLDRPRSRRSEEHTSELQSLMRLTYAVFCLNKQT